MSMGLVDIRDAVCKCINTDLQARLNDCALTQFQVGDGQSIDKFSTKAMCVYKPEYNTCKDNHWYIFVFGFNRQMLLQESIGECRGKKKHLQNITSDYSVKIEMVKKLCGKTEDEIDAYPLDQADMLQRVFETMEEMLFCKRELTINGNKFYQQDIDPISLGYDEFEFSRGLFIKNTVLTYRMVKCCPEDE